MGWNHQPVVNDDHLARGDVTKWRTPTKIEGNLATVGKSFGFFGSQIVLIPKSGNTSWEWKSRDIPMTDPCIVYFYLLAFGWLWFSCIYTSPMDPKGLNKNVWIFISGDWWERCFKKQNCMVWDSQGRYTIEWDTWDTLWIEAGISKDWYKMVQPSPWSSGKQCAIFCWYGCRKDGCCSKNEYNHSNEYHHEWWCYISPPLPHVIVSSLAGGFNKTFLIQIFFMNVLGPAKAASLAVFFGGSRGLEPYIRSQELYIYIYLKSSPPTNPRLVSAKTIF